MVATWGVPQSGAAPLGASGIAGYVSVLWPQVRLWIGPGGPGRHRSKGGIADLDDAALSSAPITATERTAPVHPPASRCWHSRAPAHRRWR